MKNKIFSFSIFILFVFLLIPHIFASTSLLVSSDQKFGSVVISVFNIQDHLAIENATIVILETQEYYQSGKLGATQTIELPTETKNKLTFSSPSKDWTEYTLLIYKNGFYPHIHHGLKITPNYKKIGVIINLTPISSSDTTTHTESYEYPPTNWSIEIIDKYRKK